MITQPNCGACTLPGKAPVWGRGKKGGLVVISDAPSGGTPMGTGNAHKVLQSVTQGAGWADTPMFVTTLTMCRPAKDASEHEVACCLDRLKAEVLDAQPTHILLLGTKVSKALLGKLISKSRGQLTTLWGIPTMATYSPSYVMNNPEAYRDLDWDITKLRTKTYVDHLPEAKKHCKISTVRDALAIIAKLSGKVSLDIETKPAPNYVAVPRAGLNPRMNQLTRIGLYDSKLGAIVFKGDAVCREVVEAIEAQGLKIICHNADFEIRNLLHHYGVSLTVWMDTMLAHHAIDERNMDGESSRAHPVARNLKTLGRLYFDLDDWSGVAFDEDNEELDDYLAVDVWVTRMLADELHKEIIEEDQEAPFFNLTMPLRHVLSSMTHRGVLVDRDYLTELDYQFGRQLEEVEAQMEAISPAKFSPTAPLELAHVLYDVMGLPRLEGNSTKASVLMALSDEIGTVNNLPELMLQFRKLQKAHSTYVLGLSSAVDDDGRIRSKFNQHRTTTYRLSSDEPNLQNIPSTRSAMGRLIRNVFIAPENHSFLELDYSQIEVFVMALVADDPMLQQVLSDGDIYKHMGSRFYGVSYDDVTKEQRNRMKPIVLGALYDRRAPAIAAVEHMEVGVVQRQLDTFFAEFPRVRAYLDRQPKVVMEDGYVQSLFGRRRRFSFVTADNKLEVARQAINAPIQGSACDIVCLALRRIESEFAYIADLILQIHDSLTYYVHDRHIEEAHKLISNEMVREPFPNCPLKFRVESKVGKRWGDLEDYS